MYHHIAMLPAQNHVATNTLVNAETPYKIVNVDL